jgi:hypothetical protein
MRYCSLGQGCHSAAIFKYQGLKVESFPFDWMNSRSEMIKHCIEDDFKTFLNREQYCKIDNHWDDHECCQHDFYAPLLQDNPKPEKHIIFRHRDPMMDDDAYNYYKRCVERFRDLLSSDEQKTFLIIYPNKDSDITASIKDALLLSQFFEKHTTNFKIIAVHHYVTGYRSHRLINGRNLMFVNLTTVTQDEGGDYSNHEDNMYLNDIIKKLL